MDNTNPYDEFLDAVEVLHDSDTAPRTTAHTSSVSEEGWIADEPDTATDHH
ncbi:MAG: hypothetical protein H7Y15_04460 [Pseudonocardia sp.]|nr:hypothetical protein [Pseudonocardia sp.]